jgi:hypothetical protein
MASAERVRSGSLPLTDRAPAFESAPVKPTTSGAIGGSERDPACRAFALLERVGGPLLRSPRRVAAICASLGALCCGNGDDSASAAPAASASPDAGGDATSADAHTTDAADASAAQETGAGTLFDASVPGTTGDGSLVIYPCNGDYDPGFCDKTYDAVTYAATHAAMAYAFPPFPCPAQRLTVRQQLDMQVRALGFEAHPAHAVPAGASSIAFCMGDCASGELRADIALADVRAFLDVNPREVVTLLIEGGADGPTLASAIAAAGLDTYAFAHAPGDRWATLQEMITTGKRVVVFADVADAGATPA